MTIPAPAFYCEETFQRADSWSAGIREEIASRCHFSKQQGFQEDWEEFEWLNFAGNSLNVLCPSPQCLCGNDLGMWTAMSWFSTKTLITIKPQPWQTFTAIFPKSAIVGSGFLSIHFETTNSLSCQPLSFWNLYLDQLEVRLGALGSRC